MPPPDYCPFPDFVYEPAWMAYRPCSTCGQLAWSHRNSRPLEDVTNHLEWVRLGRPGIPPHPVVDPG